MATAERVAPIGNLKAINLLSPRLQNRDIRKRFTPEEKILLAQNIREVWRISPKHQETVPIVAFNTVIKSGAYKDEEPYLLKSPNIPIGNQLDITANLQTPQDVLNLRSVIDELGNPETTLATMIFPLERGDKPAIRTHGEKMIEVLLLRRLIRDLSVNNIRRLIMSGSHSPAFSFFALEAGISVIDVIPLPAMFGFAVEKGFLKDEIIVPVTSDEGARDMGQLIEKLAGEKNISSEATVHAHKTKANNKVTIHFKEGNLEKIKGKTAVIPEDILSTGGTIEDTTNQLLGAGAKEVVILVTYPFFAGDALERLGNKEKITIITTDGLTPLRDIMTLDGQPVHNIIQIPILEHFSSIMNLYRQGVDFWSREGKQELKNRGFCLNPWMDVP